MSHQGMVFWGDKVFSGLRTGEKERSLFIRFLENTDYRPATLRAVAGDIRAFVEWFNQRNGEAFLLERITSRDVTDFRNHLRETKGLAVATVNRVLVFVRRFLESAVEQGDLPANPAKRVKELRRVELAPKGLDRQEVRRLLRETELRRDVRADAVFHILLFTGCRVSDLVHLELTDLSLAERSGGVTFRFGKGGKERCLPLPLPARRALEAWLSIRPATNTPRVFVGKRGPLTERGIRAMCDRYSALLGVKIHPHLLRHTMAKRFLEDNQNDLVSLSMLLGHESLNTTRRYSLRSASQLAEQAEKLNY